MQSSVVAHAFSLPHSAGRVGQTLQTGAELLPLLAA